MAWVVRLARILAALLLVLVLAGLAGIWYIGAWHIVFPSHSHESVPPTIPDSLAHPAILLFTKTNGFRHREGIAAGADLVKTMAQRRGWSVFHTENGAVFNEADLARFDVVMFHNVSGDVLSDEQQRVFQAWLQAGGGWMGVHAAGDGSHSEWPWYVENLIGARFTAHIMGPQFQVAEVLNEDPDHPVMAGLPTQWQHEEEWYSWEQSPRQAGFEVLAIIDEDSYSPVQKFAGQSNDLRMGYHPVVWSRCIGSGRSLYSAMGHSAAAYDNAQHQRLLENGLDWAMDRDACKATP